MIQQFKAYPKSIRILIISFVLIFLGLVAFNIAKKAFLNYFFKHFEPPAVTVSSTTVKEMTWHPNLHAVGEFVAVNGVDINTEAAGTVVGIHFNSGEYIEKDKLLVQIDDSVDQASLKSYEANLAFQKINYKRQAELLKKNATSRSEVDAAQAEMLEAEASVEKTKAIIAEKHIETPFAGKLGIRQIDLGQYVMPGRTTIVTLQSLDPLFVEFYVPEQKIQQIKVGQNILFFVEPNTKKLFTGKVTAINAKVDSQTHNIKVQATIPNCPIEVFGDDAKSSTFKTQKARHSNRVQIICDSEKNKAENTTDFAFIPGMFTSIEVEQPAKPNTLVLPTTAISYSLYGNSVFVIQQKMENGKVQTDKDGEPILIVKRVFVTTGDEQGNLVVIKKGLKAGDTVVSAGEVKLANGTRVVINNSVALNASTQPTLFNE